MKITDIKLTSVSFGPLEKPFWNSIKKTSSSGGDSLRPHDTDAVIGQGLFDVLLNDDIGLGLQVAVTDAAGKSVGSPAHALLGTKLRDRCPISWWDIDMPPEDWVAEAREAMKRGYTSFKMKARPWRDIHEQVKQVGNVVPDDFKFDIDFNGFLLNESFAETVLHRLDGHPNVGIFETPLSPDGRLVPSSIRRLPPSHRFGHRRGRSQAKHRRRPRTA